MRVCALRKQRLGRMGNLPANLGDIAMQILTSPNPILREPCADVVVEDEPNLRNTMLEMAELMYDACGCGLAGPQVGISKKIIVVDCDYSGAMGIPKNPMLLVNPRIESAGGEKATDEEGCLSIPGITVPVARFENVAVEALDPEGNPVSIEASGFLARCLQHEIDHLSGITLFETMNMAERLKKLVEYKIALQKGKQPGEVD